MAGTHTRRLRSGKTITVKNPSRARRASTPSVRPRRQRTAKRPDSIRATTTRTRIKLERAGKIKARPKSVKGRLTTGKSRPGTGNFTKAGEARMVAAMRAYSGTSVTPAPRRKRRRLA